MRGAASLASEAPPAIVVQSQEDSMTLVLYGMKDAADIENQR
jgi:hypothetical protein